MKTKKQLFRAGSILGYVASFFYFCSCAYAFALNDAIYWLFLVLGIVVLYSSLLVSSLIPEIPFDKKRKKITLLVATIISFVGILSGVLDLLGYLYSKEEKTILVPNPAYQEAPKVEKPKKKWYKKANFIVLCASLLTIGVASFTAQLFETSAYSVEVKDFTLTEDNSYVYGMTPINGRTHPVPCDYISYSATIYSPKTATAENPAPCIFVMPGFTRTKATMAQYAIEYSRRGAVVVVIDPNSQGDSTYDGYQYDANGNLLYDEDGKPLQTASTSVANGLTYFVHYFYTDTDDYPFIDRNRFGAIGHSAGGGDVVTTAAELAGTSYETSVLKSIYISGYIKTSAANKYAKLRCNAAQSYAYYDEGAFRYQSDVTAPEVINRRFINEVNGSNNGYESVAIDYPYGSMEEGTYRIVHRENTNHCFEMYDRTSIVNTISFFSESLGIGSGIANDSLTWLGKEISNGAAFAASFVFYAALSGVLLGIPFFAKIKGKKADTVFTTGETDVIASRPEETKPATKKNRFRGKATLWGTTLFSAILACLDYIPLAHLSMHWFPDAASNTFTFFFPARMFNAVLLWGVINGLIGIVLFFGVTLIEDLVELIKAKREGRKPVYDWSKFKPLKMNLPELGIMLLLSAIVFALYYFVVQLNVWVFHQDFRFLLLSASPINARFFVTWLEYFPLLFLFYFSNSLKVNISFGHQGWKEWEVYLAGIIANSIGLVFILFINYVAFFHTGVPYYGYWGSDNREVWLYINMVFGVAIMMAILPAMNRILYKQSKNIYYAALVNVMIFVMMSLTATVSYIPM